MSTGKNRDEFTFLTIFPRHESIFDFQYLLIVTYFGNTSLCKTLQILNLLFLAA